MMVKEKSKKNIYIKGVCHACHYNGKLDNTHKLATYIKKVRPKPWAYEKVKGKKNDGIKKKRVESKKKDGKKKRKKDKVDLKIFGMEIEIEDFV